MAKKPAKKTKHYLTPAQKQEAVRLFHTGRFTRAELATKFDISPTTLGKLINATPAPADPGELTSRGEQLLRLGEAVGQLRADAKACGVELEISIVIDRRTAG